MAVFGLVLALLVPRGNAQQAPSSSPAPPTGSVSPPLPVDAAMKTFSLPAGYRLEIVASEPLVVDPVAIDWDPDGRMWVVEMPGYMRDIQAAGELEPLGRVVVLEDVDGDAKMDKRTIFAEGLVLARAIKVLDRGVLVGEPPNLWLMRDTDGDLRMDAKELVSDRYGRREANVEHNANSLFWALDNWIHTSEVDMFLRLKNGKFEVRSTPARGQWGVSQDDAGRLYRNTNPSALHVDLVPTPYYGRNPDLRRTRGSYEFLGADDSLNTVWPTRPTPAVNRGYQSGVLRADGTLAAFTAASAPTVYRGDRLPADLYGNVFVAEPAGHLVSRIIVVDDGRTLRGRKAYERQEFLASTDERFRPVNLSSAPDGTLYVVDMYRGVIQHRAYITEYLRDRILERNLEAPIHYGRIYRVVHETTQRGPRPSLSAAPASRRVETLAHANGWWRDTAQRLLVERGDKSVAGPLASLARSAPTFQTRLHALWTLDGLDALEPSVVTAALADSAREVRVSAVRLSERWLRERGHPLHAAVQKRMTDPDWNVRQQVAASLGELAEGKEAALASVLAQHATDPVIADAALSGVKGSEGAVLDLLLASNVETPARSAALTLLASAMIAGGQDALVQPLLAKVAEPKRPAWQRIALLRGAEVALLAATAPGSEGERGRGAGRDADEPCPDCPGGRAGPGGAPAFPRPGAEDTARGGGAGATPAGARGAGRGRGRGRGLAPPLKLSREPAIARLTGANGGDIGARVGAVLERLEWPGKPGVAAVTPLTAEEQARFDAGRTIYQNLCAACHQADGRGREKLANSLVGSPLAVGAPGISVRVLLHGKEGTNGLMPPLGGVLDDEQIAAVLTYIRREWGNTASPIAPAAVPPIRRATADRTRPWTDQELSTLGEAR